MVRLRLRGRRYRGRTVNRIAFVSRDDRLTAANRPWPTAESLPANSYAIPQLGVQIRGRVAPKQLLRALDQIETGNLSERRDVNPSVLKKDDQSLRCDHQCPERE
jgi:hypothetical protein